MSKLELILLLILLNSILINSVYVLTRSGMLFGFVSDWFEAFQRRHTVVSFDYLWKPLFGCIYCMASVWTLLLFPLYHWYFGAYWELIPWVMFGSISVNGFLHSWRD